jgi:hypothetical protein
MHRRLFLQAAATVAATLLLGASGASAAENATLFQVFLNDGTKVVSYGEYVRVGDRIIFSMPIGALTPEPRLHVVNLPAAAVDWDSTARYADSIRYSHYVATRAEADYAALTTEVARVLNTIVVAADARARLNLATEARRTLASWPRTHYGYRASDVQQMLALLDEAISEMRAVAGETAFAVELVATAEPPPTVTPLRNLTPAESIFQALAVAKMADVPAERISLFRAIVAALERAGNTIPAAWAKSTRKMAAWNIDLDTRIDREYSRFSSVMLKRATAAAARADVRAVESVLDGVRRRDAQFGGKRPDEINALIVGVREQLEAARRLRLMRDQWAERIQAYRAYQAAVAPIVQTLTRAQTNLDDIKRLAGPQAEVLVSLVNKLDISERMLANVSIPGELKPAHALLTTALALAENAVTTRRLAVTSGDLRSAWDASSAAAGAMMLFARSRADMEAIVKLPQVR